MDTSSISDSPAPLAPLSTTVPNTTDGDKNTANNNSNTNTHLPPSQAAAATTTATTTPSNGTDASAAAGAVSAVPVRKRTLADYRLGRTLGEGSYSTVVAAVDLSNRRDYAIKVLDKRHIIREKKVKYVNIEKNTLYKLDHPGVVKLYSTFQDSSSLYYVLELCQNGELLTYIKKLGSFDENCTRFYVAQILTAVEYVHSQGVIHRDLKPENILLDHRMYVKLTDFGTAKMLEPSEDGTESDRANSFVGTAEYVSPELLTEKAACKSSDLWALGCIIYQLLAGRPPFKGSNEYQTFQKIVRLEYTFPAGFPKTAMDLVSRLLVHDPNERLGANNAVDQLKQHPFFDGVEWSELWNQPAPKLMPYLPPTPTHNTEALRSDHDACLWSMNRTGETLMVVDPFRELGDSGSSVDNSGRNSMNGHGGHDTDESDGSQIVNAGVHVSSDSAVEVTPTSQSLPALPTLNDSSPATHMNPTTISSTTTATTTTTTAAAAEGEPLPSNGGPEPSHSATLSTPGAAIPKSSSASAAVGSSTSNGHIKTKSGSRNVFVALFSGSKQSSGKKLLGKKIKAGDEAAETSQQRLQTRQDQVERLVGGVRREGTLRKSGGISRENSSVSLAVTANEMSAYSRRTQLELQAELSPWQSFLLPTELVLHQTPILKRKGLFSRSCILVLTDFPRLLYFDDSNHYFSQLFNSNTNEAFSSWQQQQMLLQWDQSAPSHVHQQEQGAGTESSLSKRPSLRQAIGRMSLDLPPPLPTSSQDVQTHHQHQHQQHLNAAHQPLHPHSNPHPRRNTGGLDGITSGSGFLLTRSGSHPHRGGVHHRSEQTSPLGAEGRLSEEDVQDVAAVDRPQGLSVRSPRASMEDQIHQHSPAQSQSHLHSHPHPHPRHQTSLQGHGQNKIDAEKRASGSGFEDEHHGGSDNGINNGTTSTNNSNNGSSVTMGSSSGGGGGGGGGSTTVLQGSKMSSSSSSSVMMVGGSPAPSSSTTTLSRMGIIKAPKKQAKLRGEILFTASVVSELKGKKCFFIHTTKKSYYFEEANQEGDAKTWVRILERSMEGWFGEGGIGGNGSADTNGSPAALTGSTAE
ncbi:pkb-activating kinase-like protein [Linnemannia gamsii]|uniref:non-specific serine/threonine protein kinase n=1 Tax=Linnemannia gamsii TaxID=64522 RepID=A0ABQ7KCW0_9FUNG|nr:pkb-activating kinase-like protein [Linnemannia gamsii]